MAGSRGTGPERRRGVGWGLRRLAECRSTVSYVRASLSSLLIMLPGPRMYP